MKYIKIVLLFVLTSLRAVGDLPSIMMHLEAYKITESDTFTLKHHVSPFLFTGLFIAGLYLNKRYARLEALSRMIDQTTKTHLGEFRAFIKDNFNVFKRTTHEKLDLHTRKLDALSQQQHDLRAQIIQIQESLKRIEYSQKLQAETQAEIFQDLENTLHQNQADLKAFIARHCAQKK